MQIVCQSCWKLFNGCLSRHRTRCRPLHQAEWNLSSCHKSFHTFPQNVMQSELFIKKIIYINVILIKAVYLFVYESISTWMKCAIWYFLIHKTSSNAKSVPRIVYINFPCGGACRKNINFWSITFAQKWVLNNFGNSAPITSICTHWHKLYIW